MGFLERHFPMGGTEKLPSEEQIKIQALKEEIKRWIPSTNFGRSPDTSHYEDRAVIDTNIVPLAKLILSMNPEDVRKVYETVEVYESKGLNQDEIDEIERGVSKYRDSLESQAA